MASLVEELIQTLSQEYEIYQELIPLAQAKTEIIIKNDLEGLQKVTDQEQETVDLLTHYENKRMEVLQNIGTVINKDPATLSLKSITKILESQPKEQRQLAELDDKLKTTIQTLVTLNQRNKELIDQSLEIINFNMNFIQSTRMLPGNNYDKGATQTNDVYFEAGMFDARQ